MDEVAVAVVYAEAEAEMGAIGQKMRGRRLVRRRGYEVERQGL